MTVNMKMKILTVDDDRVMLRIFDGYLKKLGFSNIVQATDGEMALRFLRDGPFDLVISDWNMQPVSGLELLKQMRADLKLKHIPFIMVTTEGKAENVTTARAAGVNNYIIKPFDGEILRQKLIAVIGAF